MKRRFYTTGEIARIRALWDTHTVEDIAEMLNRPVKGLRLKAASLGLWKFHPYATLGPEAHVFFAEQHTKGYSDTEISEMWGCHRQVVGRWRRRNGLPNNLYNKRHIAKVQKQIRRQLYECGVANLAELRVQGHRIEAMRRGWPEDCTPRECDILEAIEAGHDTLPAICKSLGLTYRPGKALHAGGNSYTGHLMRKGYIVSPGRRNYKPGGGCNVAYYRLAIQRITRAQDDAA